MAVAANEPPTLELFEDPRDVLAAPAAEAREVGLRHLGATTPSAREIVKVRRDELEEPLGHAALEIEEQEIVDERLVLLDLAGERLDDGAGARRGRQEATKSSQGAPTPRIGEGEEVALRGRSPSGPSSPTNCGRSTAA